MLSYKKPSVDKYLDPLIKPFKHVSPNALTLLGIIPSILFFIFVINGWYVLALISIAGWAFDMIDGMVARKYNKATKFGGFLDSTSDRVSDFLIISAFGFAGIVKWEIVALVILFSFLISYIRARGESINTKISFSVGLMERTERLILIAIAFVLYTIFPNFTTEGFNITEIVFITLAALLFYTIIQRIIHVYKNL